MKRTLFTMAAAGLIASAQAQDAKDEPAAGAEPGAKIGAAVGAVAGAVVGGDVEKKSVVATLEGQLIEVDGEKVKGGKLDDGMEYYLVYHSASW